jgi:hypothetical protein
MTTPINLTHLRQHVDQDLSPGFAYIDTRILTALIDTAEAANQLNELLFYNPNHGTFQTRINETGGWHEWNDAVTELDHTLDRFTT